MNIRTVLSLVLVSLTLALGGCASTIKKTAVGTYLIAEEVGTINRSMTKYGEYNCPEDKDGNPILGKCTVASGTQPPERAHGQTVAGQSVVAVLGGTGAALINANTARVVAKIGQCAGGGNCGTVINNQVQSVAEALNQNQNQSTVKVGIGSCPVKGCPD